MSISFCGIIYKQKKTHLKDSSDMYRVFFHGCRENIDFILQNCISSRENTLHLEINFFTLIHALMGR